MSTFCSYNLPHTSPQEGPYPEYACSPLLLLFAVVLLILRKWIKTVNNLHYTGNQFHLKLKKKILLHRMYNCKQKEHVCRRNEKSFSFWRCFDLKQSNHIGKKQVFFQHNASMLFLIGSKNSCDLQSRYRADDGSNSERKGRKEKRYTDGGQRKATRRKLLLSPPFWWESNKKKKNGKIKTT